MRLNLEYCLSILNSNVKDQRNEIETVQKRWVHYITNYNWNTCIVTSTYYLGYQEEIKYSRLCFIRSYTVWSISKQITSCWYQENQLTGQGLEYFTFPDCFKSAFPKKNPCMENILAKTAQHPSLVCFERELWTVTL